MKIAEDYLQRKCKIPPYEEPLWTKGWDGIKDLYRIRNCIAHNSGYVPDDTDKNAIEATCRKNNEKIGIVDDRLFLSDEYIDTSFDLVQSFYTTILTIISPLVNGAIKSA